MRLGQSNKRMRGRNRNSKGPNPLTRSYESNGPDVKVRGTAQHIAEKYAQLARDAHASGDPVMAESYLQHAEHYYRIIITAHAAQAANQQNPSRSDDNDMEDLDDAEDMPFAEIQMKLQQQQQERQDRQQERGDRPQQDRHQDRDRGQDRPRFDRSQPRPQPVERPEFGEQPSVEFPQRPEQGTERGERQDRNGQDRGDRPFRQQRQDRPRFERRPASTDAEAPVEAGAEPSAPVDNADGPAEAGLPSFLTRGRRRARPPFRRRDGEGGEDGSEAAQDGASQSNTDQPAS